jgi:hypothetical protein
VTDEKEATFGADKLPVNPSPELMTISLNDLGESDNESVSDLISPKASPMNRIPSAPTHVPKHFNFTSVPTKIEEEEDSEEDNDSDEEIDVDDMTDVFLRAIIEGEMDY